MRVQHERMLILDLLRGLAIFGMVIVHLNDNARVTSRIGEVVNAATGLLVEEKAYATFAVLFGAGFGLQILSAHERGEPFVGKLLRRLLGVGLFGIVAAGIFGFHILVYYAIWGVPLLFMWRWTTRALAIAVFLCATSLSLYQVLTGPTNGLR